MVTTRQTKRDAKKLFRLCLTDGMLDPQRTRDVVKLVGESRYRRRLSVLWVFRRLVALYTARHTATVKSALPLAKDLIDEIQSGLSRQYGPGLAFSFTQDRGLLGGMRIKVSSDVYDGSVRARLHAVEERF
jgi:F-type H+-transporting ATPase subunit delta